MVTRPTTQLLESIHRLNTGSKDWLKLVASIRVDRDILVHRFRDCMDSDELRIYQGQLKWVDNFLSILDNTSTTLHKRKEIK